jgi:hypothetical protein
MRAVAPLFCLAAACASAPARTKTELDVAQTPPQPAAVPPALQQASPMVLAERIVEAQRATSTQTVTPLFDGVRADLQSNDGVRVLRGLRVIDEIGVQVRNTRTSRGDMDQLFFAADHLEPVVDAIDDVLVWLQQAGACATDAEVRQTAAQFQTIPRTRTSGRSAPPSYVGRALPKRLLECGMSAVKNEVAACFALYKVPGIAMVNVVIARSGKVSSAMVKGAFAGTPTGACVENAVKSALFPPSDGFVTLYPFALK